MNFSTLTLNERERLAYAEGYTETAAILAEMSDLKTRADTLENELETTKDRLDEVETQHHALIDERDWLEDELQTARALIDERDWLEDELQTAREELTEAQDLAKTYRAALMALESEVSAPMRKFIREVLQ